MHHLLDDASRRAQRYLSELDSRPVFPSDAMRARLGELGGPLPAEPTPAADVTVASIAAPSTVRRHGDASGQAESPTLRARRSCDMRADIARRPDNGCAGPGRRERRPGFDQLARTSSAGGVTGGRSVGIDSAATLPVSMRTSSA